MKNKLTFILLTFCLNLSALGQKIDYSHPYHLPLDLDIILAGNFGELRSNHFHTGIDIKTERQIGHNIYAVEDGYVSRIAISPWGYGHVVYIDHPTTGLTSVYGHLHEFVGDLYETAYQQQKKGEGFQFDYSLPKDSLPVKKGQLIAKSGNTGGSQAPHLHFEFRKTLSEHPINPLLFDVFQHKIPDTKPPVVRRAKVYALNEKGYRIPKKSKFLAVHGANGNYRIAGDKITLPAFYAHEKGGIGFAFDVIDQLNGATNICGVFKTHLIVDSDTVYTQNMEELSFSSIRQINTHKDYEEYWRFRRHFHKTFRIPHNTLPIYRKLKNNGIIDVEPGKEYEIQYIAEDAYGNKSTLSFALVIQDGEPTEDYLWYAGRKVMYPDSVFLSYDQNHYIMFPPQIIYEPTPLIIQSEPNRVRFGNTAVPLQETFKIMLPIPHEKWSDKSYIQRANNGGGKYAERGTVNDGWITARVREFGVFSVEIDTIPPTIRGRNFKNHGNVNGRKLIWNISDKGVGLKKYNIYIDDEWFLLEYEPKQASFFFWPPKELTGKKKVVIRAEDYCGNVKEEEWMLTF